MNSHDSNHIYHEKQVRELCALHALNNLFQTRGFFTKIELDTICHSLSPDVWINPHKSVFGLGNYDINVIMKALQGRGYEAIWFDKRKDPSCLNLDNISGFILNVPSDYKIGFVMLPLRRRHWITLRQINGLFYNLDSKLDAPQVIGSKDDLTEYLKEQLECKDKELFLVVENEVDRAQSWLSNKSSYTNHLKEREAEILQLKDIYTSLSKRYLPAAINFLTGILHMAIPKSGIKLIKVLPPFRSTTSALVLFKNCSSLNMCLKLEATDLTDEEISEDFKIRTLYTCLKLISEFKENFKGLSSVCEIFEPIMQFLEQIPVCNYPEDVQNEIRNILTELNTLKTQHKLEYIVMEAKKPKALRLYEPNIQKVYDGKKHRVMSREKAEREKLLHKIKKEHKGALREIRRDRAFLGRVKIKQKIQSDKQRQDKVKQLYAEASIQQSELNAMDRKKKRK